MSAALKGIKVIDLSQVAAVPMCARFLADFGADVVHIENPKTGDSWRNFQAAQTIAMSAAPSEINYNFETYNRNKRSITLNISSEEGRKILMHMVEQADVFVTNLRQPEMKRYRLSYADLDKVNHRIVYASVNGYGKHGRDKDLPSYDTTAYWSRSGIPQAFSVPGVPVMGYRPAFGDNVAGLALAFGVMTALYVREKTGVGQEIDTSLLHIGMYQISFDINGALATGLDFADWRESPPEATVTKAQLANMEVGQFYAAKATNPLSAAYITKDTRRIFFLSLQPDRYWKKFCLAIGREDLANDPLYETTKGRAAHNAALRKTIGETFITKTQAEWIPLLEGLPYAPAQSVKEATMDQQARHNGFVISYDHPTYGRLESLANPVNMSKTPAEYRLPAPEIGQHTEEVLLEYGYDWEDIANFKEQGAIG